MSTIGWELAEAGATRAAQHADRTSADWTDRAYDCLQSYCAEAKRLHRTHITSEGVRKAAEGRWHLPTPPDSRAWGAVILRARRAGLITKDGWTTAEDPKVHSNPVSLWRVL